MDCNLMKCRHAVVIVSAILLMLFSVFEIVVGVIEPNKGGLPNDGAIGTIIPTSALISFGVLDLMCVIFCTLVYFHLSLNQRSFDDDCVLGVGFVLTMVYFCFSFGFSWYIFAHAYTFSNMFLYTMLTHGIILSVMIFCAILFGLGLMIVCYLVFLKDDGDSI